MAATSIPKQVLIAENKAESQVLRIKGYMRELTFTTQGAWQAVDQANYM